MKCKACGFKRGEEEFIWIYSDHKFTIDNPNECKDGEYNYSDRVGVQLFACPKCKTVVMD